MLDGVDVGAADGVTDGCKLEVLNEKRIHCMMSVHDYAKEYYLT
jgi:hypothetical protein